MNLPVPFKEAKQIQETFSYRKALRSDSRLLLKGLYLLSNIAWLKTKNEGNAVKRYSS